MQEWKIREIMDKEIYNVEIVEKLDIWKENVSEIKFVRDAIKRDIPKKHVEKQLIIKGIIQIIMIIKGIITKNIMQKMKDIIMMNIMMDIIMNMRIINIMEKRIMNFMKSMKAIQL